MKILFVKTEISVSTITNFDPGIASMSAVLKEKGHETSYFNIRSWDYLDEFKRRIDTFNPDIIGFSCTATTFFLSDKFAEFAKKCKQNVFCLTGGVHITLNPNDFSKTQFLDAVCIGEGEYSLLELAAKYKTGEYMDIDGINFKKGGETIVNKKRQMIENLDDLPMPDRDIFANEGSLFLPQSYGSKGFSDVDQKMEFMFSRGCPFDCTYCSNNALKGFFGSKYIRFRSPKLAVKEIEEVIKKYRVNYVTFHDDIFILNKKWIMEFLDLYKKKIKIPFECNVRVGANTDEQIIKKLKSSGCDAVKIGVESGSERVRTKILNRNMSNKQIISTCNLFDSYKIGVIIFLIVGFPGENKKEIIETIKLASILPCRNFALYIFYPYPGTRLYELCKNDLLINDSYKFKERSSAAIETKYLTKYDVEYFFEYFSLMLNLNQKRGTKIQQIYKSVLFKLYCVAPSDYLYLISKLLAFCLMLPVYISRTSFLASSKRRFLSKFDRVV